MNVKDFKSVLKARKARWQIRADIDDKANLSDISDKIRHPGALPPLPGAPTARMPKMRRDPASAVHLWQPKTILRMRAASALPTNWDWRNVTNKNWVTPVRNQGGCGSCVAFATSAAVEIHRRIEINNHNLNIDLSEASLFFTADRQCNVGDPRYGWWNDRALDCLMDEGICTEDVYPYRAVNQESLISTGTVQTFKISGYDSTTNTTQMKRWLCEEGPLVTSFTVYDDFFTFFRSGSGVYTYASGERQGGHAVTVIGYDDNDSCWICKNSWGSSIAHSDGCFRIGYGECGIDSRMYCIQDVHEVITRDEIAYNPRTLQIVYLGSQGWLLTDGRSRMKLFDTAEDARNGLRVARRHTRQGFVGRDNPRSKRMDYIMEYWTGSSGLPYEPLTKTDAIPYNPNNALVEDLDAQGWRIRDGSHWMLLAHDMNDALAMLNVVERHSRICFIGRGNKRPNRKNYIMTYWE